MHLSIYLYDKKAHVENIFTKGIRKDEWSNYLSFSFLFSFGGSCALRFQDV